MKELPKETINNPSAVEDIFCKKFQKILSDVRLLRPMDEHEMKIMLAAVSVDMVEGTEDPFDSIKEDPNAPFIVKLTFKILETRFTFTCSNSLKALIAIVSETAGTAIMYLTYLQCWAKHNKRKYITAEDFSMEIFPNGFPKKEQMQNLWDCQKVDRAGSTESDNLLDYQSALKSIQFLEDE